MHSVWMVSVVFLLPMNFGTFKGVYYNRVTSILYDYIIGIPFPSPPDSDFINSSNLIAFP